MNGRKTFRRAGYGKGVTSRSTRTIATAPAPRPNLSPRNETLRQRKDRKLIRQHLDQLLDKLFPEITGLHFHVTWSPSPPHEWLAQTLPTGCCCRLVGAGSHPAACCRTCAPGHFDAALSAAGNGHHFNCRLGARNFWLPIHVRGELLGMAYLQALDHSTCKCQDGKRSAHPGHRRSRRADASVMGRLKFVQATRLLQLIVQHVQTASLADLRKADLTSAVRIVVALEKEQARLHEVLQRHLPITPETSRRTGPESHPEQIVHRLLECIEQNDSESITLQNCACKLGMNPAYASALFSRVVGVPFKTHLTELRIEKAKALLGDPAKSASDVASAVGYASENRFRIAFKKATGLSPKLWRETMQTNPLPTLSP